MTGDTLSSARSKLAIACYIIGLLACGPSLITGIFALVFTWNPLALLYGFAPLAVFIPLGLAAGVFEQLYENLTRTREGSDFRTPKLSLFLFLVGAAYAISVLSHVYVPPETSAFSPMQIITYANRLVDPALIILLAIFVKKLSEIALVIGVKKNRSSQNNA